MDKYISRTCTWNSNRVLNSLYAVTLKYFVCRGRYRFRIYALIEKRKVQGEFVFMELFPSIVPELPTREKRNKKKKEKKRKREEGRKSQRKRNIYFYMCVYGNKIEIKCEKEFWSKRVEKCCWKFSNLAVEKIATTSVHLISNRICGKKIAIIFGRSVFNAVVRFKYFLLNVLI